MTENKLNIRLSKPDINEKDKQAVLDVLNTPYISQGPKIKEFEQKVANYVGLPYAIAVNSGTSALHLIVRSLGLKEGDEVITTPFSFIASSNCLLMEDVKPVFVDIDENTMNIDPKLIEQRITEKTKAILPVHIFGFPVEMKKIKEIADKKGLKIIEDACEAFGTEVDGKKVGRDSDAAVFAFYPNKQMTTGEGGVVVTANEEIAKLSRSMRNQGRGESGGWFNYERMGYNYRLDEMSAALGVTQLERLDEIIEKRKKIAEKYYSKLSKIKGVRLPPIAQGINVSWFMFVIRISSEKRDKVIKYLQDNGVECREYFPCIHLMSLFKEKFGYKEGDFPIAEKVSKETIALPFHNDLTDEEIDYVVKKVEDALKEEKMSFKRFNELKFEDFKNDSHMHTNQTDAKSTAEEMIASAEEKGMKRIVITEHVNRTTDWYPKFKELIESLREKKNIQVLAGIEARAKNFEGDIEASEEILNLTEFVVGSVHSYPKEDGGFYTFDELKEKGQEWAMNHEFKLIMGMLRNKKIDVIGHPFGVYSNFFGEFPEEQIRQILIESLKEKKAIEINTKYKLDRTKLFRLMKEINPYVSIGSDAHHTSEIARDFDKVWEMIK